MVSSFVTVCRNGVDVGAGVTGIVTIKVAVGMIDVGVIVWYGVRNPVGIIVVGACTVAWLQLLNSNPNPMIR